MTRSYYSNTIQNFLIENEISILGHLSSNHKNRTLEELQKNAWMDQIRILKSELFGFEGQIYFEFVIPRMGKRVDNIIIINDTVFVVEFKVGASDYDSTSINQVIDYTLDLKNFHEGSHHTKLVPILVATEGKTVENNLSEIFNMETAAKSGKSELAKTLQTFSRKHSEPIDVKLWEESIYKPTPTIIEACQALYKGHNVEEISRSDAGAINLSKTANCLNRIIEDSKLNHKKSICLVTGVPGAGKTLAGLNIANERMKAHEDEHAVFLSGNGPLVDVLREALTRDTVKESKENGERISKTDAKRKTSTFIQNIHHFRDEYHTHEIAPTERVVVFDEAQRAWNTDQVSKFMKTKKGILDFDMSEPEFLISVMDRHDDWCTIICLIGGGQEINTGEAGIEEWLNSLKNHFTDWNIHYSHLISEDNNYLKTNDLKSWLKNNAKSETELHLAVSIRSFRSEKLSEFVHNLLDLKKQRATELFAEIKNDFPIVLTRDLQQAKTWLENKSKGNERTGILVSSGAKRLKPCGVDGENGLRSNSGSDKIANWFLNPKDYVRSSYYLETAATQFVIQGLELDYTCVAWGADLRMTNDIWEYKNFTGTSWNNVNTTPKREFCLNSYRVLLTRARQGMVIYLPHGSDKDKTRSHEYYDNTYNYLKEIGIRELD